MTVSAALLAVSLAALPQSTSTASADSTSTVSAQSPSTGPPRSQAAPESTPRESGATVPEVDFRRFPHVLGSTFTRGLLSRANLPVLGVGAVGTAVVYPFDQRWSDAWGGQAPGIGRAADLIGGPILAAGVGGMLVTAPFTHNTRFRATAFTMTQALVLDTVLTQGLKFAVGRTRPNGSNTRSFPSGHTADTFMAATVLTRYFGLKLGIPAYAVATLVAVGRIESRDHYPSDTVAGAAIGYLSAEGAIRAVEHDGEGRVTVAPLIGRRDAGVFVAITF